MTKTLREIGRALLVAILPCLLGACMSTTQSGVVGVKRSQLMLSSSQEVEKISAMAYEQQNTKAKEKGHLVKEGPKLERLKGIANHIIPQTKAFLEDAAKWHWQVVLIDEKTVNASCAAGGKITFYTGLVDGLKLTDSEVAAVMSHEIGHALREHSREKYSQAIMQGALVDIASIAAPNAGTAISAANAAAEYVVNMPYSRVMETEADEIGLELMARAGYNPNAAVTMQHKLGEASKGKAPPQILSTHPSSETRIKDLTRLVPQVMPLYEKSEKQDVAPEPTGSPAA